MQVPKSFDYAATSVSRSVERLVERRLSWSSRMEWRKERWGAVMLTEREYQAVCYEREAIAARSKEYREADRFIAQAHKERLERAKSEHSRYEYRVLVETGFFEAQREAQRDSAYRQIEGGIHAQVASRLGVTRQRASALLASASEVMQWLAEYSPYYVGWDTDQRGKAVLVAPVAKVERSKIIAVNFEPQKLVGDIAT